MKDIEKINSENEQLVLFVIIMILGFALMYASCKMQGNSGKVYLFTLGAIAYGISHIILKVNRNESNTAEQII